MKAARNCATCGGTYYCSGLCKRCYDKVQNVKHAEQRRLYRAEHAAEHRLYDKQWRAIHDRTEYQAAYRAKRGGNMIEREATRYVHDPHVRARRLIQQRVSAGALPRAIDCLCTDCGEQAAEYDHYLGYEKPFDGMVQPVCRTCHLKRSA
jgi:hypothetical protein